MAARPLAYVADGNSLLSIYICSKTKTHTQKL